MKNCFSDRSPEIKLFNVPAGTKKLTVRMIDEDNPYYHGGGKVAYKGESVIPAGALRSWEGPCPPQSSEHTYTFVVKTKGGKKAKAKFSQKFSR